MNKREALAVVGGLSNPSKMPGKSIGLPASECSVGGKLQKIAGSVCFNCYALKGQYGLPVVQKAQHKRLRALSDPRWISAMVTLIQGMEVFRWHDSGDIQSMEHLKSVMAVIRATPNTRHWIPTKEKALIKRWVKQGNTVPKNCIIRLSAPMIDMRIKHNGVSVPGIKFSAAHTTSPQGRACSAYKRGGECGDCRDCWDRRIDCISYPLH